MKTELRAEKSGERRKINLAETSRNSVFCKIYNSYIFNAIMPWTEEEVQAARNNTPGASNVIHFNNAGCALPTQKTLDSVINYLTKEAHTGGYVELWGNFMIQSSISDHRHTAEQLKF